jgi:hypothetical protein
MREDFASGERKGVERDFCANDCVVTGHCLTPYSRILGCRYGAVKVGSYALITKASNAINTICLRHGFVHPRIFQGWLNVMFRRIFEMDPINCMTFIENLWEVGAARDDYRIMILESGCRWNLFCDDDAFAAFCERLHSEYTDQNWSDYEDDFESFIEDEDSRGEDEDDNGYSFEASSVLVQEYLQQHR